MYIQNETDSEFIINKHLNTFFDNINKICRLCLQETKQIDVISIYNNNVTNLPKQIKDCVALEV